MINQSLNVVKYATAFKNAKPFCHVVIDDFLDKNFFEELVSALENYYDENSQSGGVSFNSVVEDGKWGSQGLALSQSLIDLGEFLKSDDLINFLKNVTGFKELKITSDLNASGYSFFHAMKPNSFLGPHTDHTVDMNGYSYHVLNIIIYASRNWDPNWGGGTTIHNKSAKIVSDIEFRPNRALIFMHSPISVHGTQRIADFAQNKRFSIYFDYYSDGKNPYEHLGYNKFQLIRSPHLFYFDSYWEFFKSKNKKYRNLWRSHLKAKIMNKLFKR
jgi:hypothetical protein